MPTLLFLALDGESSRTALYVRFALVGAPGGETSRGVHISAAGMVVVDLPVKNSRKRFASSAAFLAVPARFVKRVRRRGREWEWCEFDCVISSSNFAGSCQEFKMPELALFSESSRQSTGQRFQLLRAHLKDGQSLAAIARDLGIGLLQSSLLLGSFIGVLWICRETWSFR